MLFQFDVSGEPAREVVDLYRRSFGEGSLPDEFSIELFLNVVDNLASVDEMIVKSSDNWRIERMSLVDRNILRIGVSEILGSKDVPAKVAINEAVELAKRYGSDESAAFVNGILDRVAREESRL